MDSESIGNRITVIVPYSFSSSDSHSLVPFMILGDIRGMVRVYLEYILTAFAIPFLLAGLLVQFIGLGVILSAFRSPIDGIQAPSGPDGISITEHPDSGYRNYLRQSEAISSRDWFRKRDSAHRLYYYAKNEEGPGWVLMTESTPVVRTGLMEDGFHTTALNSHGQEAME